MKRVLGTMFALVLIGCGSVSNDEKKDAAVVSCATGCDDTFACTDDSCVNNACQFTPHDDRCNNGYGCEVGMGCVPRYGKSQARPGTSCLDVLTVLVTATDGVYWIDPDGGAPDNSFEVYCDMTTAGGGWTLVYKYVGNDTHSQVDILNTGFTPNATKATLLTERVDAVNRKVYDAFWTAKGKAWMSKWMLYEGGGNTQVDKNFAVIELDGATAWDDVYKFTPTGCSAMPGKATLKVFDDATSTLVTVGSSSYRYVLPQNSLGDGFGFLAADVTQVDYYDTCQQASGNYLVWPANLKFDVTLNVNWNTVIAHTWYARQAATRDKDRCSWFCWGAELTYSGREWYVR